MFDVNIYESKDPFEHPKGRSEVIPNQALSLREIIERSSRGQMLREVQGNELQYGEDEDEDGIDMFAPDDDKFDVRDKLSYFEARLQRAKAEQAARQQELSSKKTKVEEAKPAKATETEVKGEINS